MEITPLMIAVFLLGVSIGYILGQLKILMVKQHVLDLMEAKNKAKPKTKSKPNGKAKAKTKKKSRRKK